MTTIKECADQGTTPRLTARQEQFCQEYVVYNNAAAAARNAGYSKKSARQIGEQNLTKVDIQSRIKTLRSERMSRARLQQDDIIKMLENVLMLNPYQVLDIDIDNESVTLKSIDEIPDEYRCLITEVRGTSHGVRVKFFSKEKAIEILMRFHGMFDKKSQDDYSDIHAWMERVRVRTELEKSGERVT